jgi:molybdate transport system substrate-binding protein
MKTVLRNRVAAYMIALAVLFCFPFLSAGDTEKKITAFCGSASQPVLEEAAKIFKGKTAITVDLLFGGSGTMLSQMKLSRRGDVYIPGSPDYMIKAIRDGVVDPASAVTLAYLILAINVQHGNPMNIQNLSDLIKPGIRVAIGNPEAVCVGLYAVEMLERNGLLKQVEKNIITHAPSCEATASLVVMKKVDAVIGWDVFSKWNPDEIDTVLLKPREIPRIAYIPAAVATYSQDKKMAQKFIHFLSSPEGQKIFAKWGYITTEKEARAFTPNAEIGGEYRLPRGYTSPVKK